MHAATHYGVEAVGITLSVPQAEVARKRLQESELNHQCRVEILDYREIERNQQYDKIVSIGMVEHVGEALLTEYFRRAWDSLRPGGVFLNHGIAYSATYQRLGAVVYRSPRVSRWRTGPHQHDFGKRFASV
jgi:cyclopropane-fatty-acyl-phospholipid synthase